MNTRRTLLGIAIALATCAGASAQGKGDEFHLPDGLSADVVQHCQKAVLNLAVNYDALIADALTAYRDGKSFQNDWQTRARSLLVDWQQDMFGVFEAVPADNDTMHEALSRWNERYVSFIEVSIGKNGEEVVHWLDVCADRKKSLRQLVESVDKWEKAHKKSANELHRSFSAVVTYINNQTAYLVKDRQLHSRTETILTQLANDVKWLGLKVGNSVDQSEDTLWDSDPRHSGYTAKYELSQLGLKSDGFEESVPPRLIQARRRFSEEAKAARADFAEAHGGATRAADKLLSGKILEGTWLSGVSYDYNNGLLKPTELLAPVRDLEARMGEIKKRL